MPTILEEFENKAKSLPLKDRAALIESLISSLDELDETECEELWAQEADKRYQAYKAGTITSRPAKAVFSDAREMLKELR
ncbi:addiction module protein [Desulfobacter vibrioformis]|uniref:addiction module protein n=1 Tax=Desulfobacter vibrioformis TaxID=34031 RepID=UPI0005599FB8|nr:addiction module protein [Desulfobacter vibrioformis]